MAYNKVENLKLWTFPETKGSTTAWHRSEWPLHWQASVIRISPDREPRFFGSSQIFASEYLKSAGSQTFRLKFGRHFWQSTPIVLCSHEHTGLWGKSPPSESSQLLAWPLQKHRPRISTDEILKKKPLKSFKSLFKEFHGSPSKLTTVVTR